MLLFKERCGGPPTNRTVFAWRPRRTTCGEWIWLEHAREAYNGNEAGVRTYTRFPPKRWRWVRTLMDFRRAERLCDERFERAFCRAAMRVRPIELPVRSHREAAE